MTRRTRMARIFPTESRLVRRTFVLALAALGLLALVLLASTVLAQSPQQSYDLSWWTVDGGGGTSSTGGGYSLGGTAGQPDVGVLSGGGYTLGGGFWQAGGTPLLYHIHLPLVLRGF